MNSRVRRIAAGLMVLYALLFVQLNITQVVRADEYREHPDNRRAIIRDFTQPRGRIITSDGVVVAESVAVENDFERLRTYPFDDLYAHSAGFQSFGFGAEGIESAYNEQLSGADRDVSVQNLSDLLIDRNRTADVRLTLRHDLQLAARDALGDRDGSVVALDPRTGAVLALWSNPSFDPNILAGHDLNASAAEARRHVALDEDGDPTTKNPRLPRAYRERYFPGSTFKVVTAAAGLESGRVTLDVPDYAVTDAYLPPQTQRPIRNFGGSTCGGDLTEILRVSCNTAFAEMGIDLGPDLLADQAGRFGFDDEVPFELDTVASFFPDTAFFTDNLPLLAQSAIGQNEVQASPLQMALVAATVAADGVERVPYLVEEVRASNGELVSQTSPEVWGRPISLATAQSLQRAMEVVVESGTGRSLATDGVTVAAKTGTAEIAPDVHDGTHAWVIAFAPADDPVIALAVIVEGDATTGQQTGGRVAGPVAQAVLEAALAG